MAADCDRMHGAGTESVQCQFHAGIDTVRDRDLVFSKSNRESLETFMAVAFILALIGFAVNLVISIW